MIRKMEGYYRLKVMIIMLLIMSTCEACYEDERVALLQLKSSFNYYFRPSTFYSWGTNTNYEDDCCKWNGVECSSSTGRLTRLSIQGDYRVTGWTFDASLFFPFQQLTTLSLQYNFIIGFVHNQGFDRLSRLEKLESLDISYNQFKDKSILSSIGRISSLKSVNLIFNGLNQTTDIQWLSNLKNLEVLDLSSNYLNNDIFSIVSQLSSLKSLYLGENALTDTKGLSKLVNLEALDLSYNNLNSNITLLSLASLSSLKTLDLSFCGLNGTIDLQEVDALHNLEVLWLSGNQLTKVVASRDIGVHRNLSALFLNYITRQNGSNVELHSLGVYPNLKTIYLQLNTFEGPIFVQEEGDLSNLEELFLDYSDLDNKSFESLQGLSSLKHLSLFSSPFGLGGFEGRKLPASLRLSNFKNLEYLDLSYNALDNNILKDIEKVTSLKTLLLHDCGLKGTLPKGLCNLRNLEELYLNKNELSGTLPWCIANLTSLQKLHLSDNNFIGSISPLRSLTSLQELRFSSNMFQVPSSLEPFFNHSKLKYLYGEENHFIFEDMEVHDSTPKFQLELLSFSNTGNGSGFPEFLWHQHDLRFLNLSNIQLQGEFPYWLLENNTNLDTLSLAGTSLSGPLHLPNQSHDYLQYLDVSNNDLNGSIPAEIGQIFFPSLYTLNLSGNGLTGGIPSSFGKIRLLERLDLSSNKLSGEIPEDLGIGCSSLLEMVLSDNDFEGSILPSTASWEHLARLRVDNNKFSGNIPHNLLNCTELSMLDANNNHLSGIIPGWITNMSFLEVLDLSENRFSGRLPEQLGALQIREVYLSENMLQGSLGTAFYNCSELMTLDLSRNSFSGTIPKWIGKLPKLSYLLISHNKFEGEIPIELCSLEQLSLIDLSNNNLSGHVLSCIKAGGKFTQREGDDSYFADPPAYMDQPLVFTTKSREDKFQGSILEFISGIDLSCNNFSGKIPVEIGNLTIKALNLSHNSLIGQIPESFSNLSQIESLDLSYNNLDGKIPSQLLALNFLSLFNVSYNNLSGKLPAAVFQFSTFDNTSYEGNPSLCGPPLLQSCQSEVPPSPNSTDEDEDEDDGFMDMGVFYVSFLVSYIVMALTMVAVLYLNPYWRRKWFYMVEVSIRNCNYFMEDNVFPLFKVRAP